MPEVQMSPEEIKVLYDRKARAVGLRPSLGQATYTASARSGDGFVVEADCGNFKVRADLPPVEGGTDTAPTPGQLMRAALATCLVMGYITWAARLEVPIDDVAVTLHCENDARGAAGADPDVNPGWLSTHCVVTVTSSASPAEVERVIDAADRHSPMLQNLLRPMPITRAIEVVAASGVHVSR
jgi:uncharacterized OsmC-like protein